MHDYDDVEDRLNPARSVGFVESLLSLSLALARAKWHLATAINGLSLSLAQRVNSIYPVKEPAKKGGWERIERDDSVRKNRRFGTLARSFFLLSGPIAYIWTCVYFRVSARLRNVALE